MSRADRLTEVANKIAMIAITYLDFDNALAEDNKNPLALLREALCDVTESEVATLLETTVTSIKPNRALKGYLDCDDCLAFLSSEWNQRNVVPVPPVPELVVTVETTSPALTEAEQFARMTAQVIASAEATWGSQRTVPVPPVEEGSSPTATESTRLQQTAVTAVDYRYADVVPYSPDESDVSADPLAEPLLPTSQSGLSVNALLSEESSYLPPVLPLPVEARRPFRVVFSQDVLDPMVVMRETSQDTLLICKNKKGSGVVILHSQMLELLSSGAQKDEIIKGATVLLSGDEIIFSKRYKPHFANPLTKIVLDFLSYALPANLASLDQKTAIKAVRDCIESIRSRMLVPEVMKALSETDDVLDAASIFQKQYQTKIIEKLIFDLCAKQHDYEKRIANKQEYRGIGLFQSCNHSASKKKAAIVDVIAVAVSVFRGEAVDPAEIARIRALPATKEGTLKALCDRFYNMIPAPISVPSAGPR